MIKSLHKTICEEQTYKALFEDYAELLFKKLYYKYGEELAAQDSVQESFITLWKNCKDVSPQKARGYLYTVANNLMLNAWKHNKVVLKHVEKSEPKIDHNDPESVLRQKEYLQQYQHALAKLTPKQREAFLLNKIEGKRHQEIAQVLGITRKAVEKRLYGAIAVLKEELIELQGRKI